MQVDAATPTREAAGGAGRAAPAGDRRSGFLVLGLFTALACVALAGTYSLARLDTYRGPAAGPAATAQPSVSVLKGAYRAEPGPDDLGWAWIGDTADLRVRGNGRFWLGMRGQSLRRPRLLAFLPTGDPVTTDQVPSARSAIIAAGPFRLDGAERLTMIAMPPAERGQGGDTRERSVFLSTARLSRTPLVAVPGAGFHISELDSDGTVFNWIGRRGRLDVRSAGPSLTRFWLRFRARSIDFERPLVISGGGVRKEVRVPPGGHPGRFEVGPFPLNDGEAALTVTSKDPPSRYGRETRALSVRLDGVQPESASTQPGRP